MKVKVQNKLALLEDIRKQNGGVLTPEVVLEAATPLDSPLHNEFTWDDGEAAHKQRLHEARCLIKNIRIQVEDRGETKKHRVYVNLESGKTGNKRGYHRVDKIKTNIELRQQMEKQAWRDLNNFRARYEELVTGGDVELANIFAIIERKSTEEDVA